MSEEERVGYSWEEGEGGREAGEAGEGGEEAEGVGAVVQGPDPAAQPHQHHAHPPPHRRPLLRRPFKSPN